MFKLSSPFRFAFAMLRTAYAKARGYRVITTDAEADKRLDTCFVCEELTPDGDCRVCGCDVIAKTSLTAEQCPKKLWLRIWDKTRTIK